MSDLLDLINNELREAKMQVDQLEGILIDAKKEVKKLERMLDIYAGNTTRRATRRSNGKSKSVIVEHFQSHPGQAFSSADLATVASIERTSVNGILKALEDEGLIELDHKGGPTGATRFYKRVAYAE
jgi:response regulator of citrate/malate metabolism